jgi:hypothetical protein
MQYEGEPIDAVEQVTRKLTQLKLKALATPTILSLSGLIVSESAFSRPSRPWATRGNFVHGTTSSLHRPMTHSSPLARLRPEGFRWRTVRGTNPEGRHVARTAIFAERSGSGLIVFSQANSRTRPRSNRLSYALQLCRCRPTPAVGRPANMSRTCS